MLEKDWPGLVFVARCSDHQVTASQQLQPGQSSDKKKDFSPQRHSHYSVLFFSISFPINSRLKAGDESARACLAAAGRQLTTVRTVRNCGRGERGVEESGSWLLAPSGFTTAGSSTGAESVTERLLGGGGVGVDTGATTLQFSIFYLLWINPMQSDNKFISRTTHLYEISFELLQFML